MYEFGTHRIRWRHSRRTIGDVVHAAISTLHNAAGAVLGGLQQFGLLEVGGGAGPGKSAGIRDEELAGCSNSCTRNVRFTLPKRSDGRTLVGDAAFDELFSSKRKPTDSITAESKREPDHGAKRKYTRKEKTPASKEKQPPAGRVNAPKHQNGRYRPAKESL